MDDSSSRFDEDELDEASTPAAISTVFVSVVVVVVELLLEVDEEVLFTGKSELFGGKNGTDGDEVSKGKEKERMNERMTADYFRFRRTMMMKPFPLLFFFFFFFFSSLFD